MGKSLYCRQVRQRDHYHSSHFHHLSHLFYFVSIGCFYVRGSGRCADRHYQQKCLQQLCKFHSKAIFFISLILSNLHCLVKANELRFNLASHVCAIWSLLYSNLQALLSLLLYIVSKGSKLLWCEICTVQF